MLLLPATSTLVDSNSFHEGVSPTQSHSPDQLPIALLNLSCPHLVADFDLRFL
jgi:hypothetical protein